MLKSILRSSGLKATPTGVGETLFGDALDQRRVGNPSRHTVVLDGGADGKFVFRGNFEVEDGVVTDGTIPGLHRIRNGEKVVKAYGLHADLREQLKDEVANSGDSFSCSSRRLGIRSKNDDAIFASAKLIKAGAGDDLIISEFVDKRIKGEDGDDTIISGTGDDVLFGGKGRDVFAFREPDDGSTGSATSGWARTRSDSTTKASVRSATASTRPRS